jgi:DNA-binding transcriptional LysR family regulator
MNPAHLNHESLHAFGVFAECMNFSLAAQRLHISQPALHVKIRKLAEQLDRELYRRIGRRLVLTEHGEQVALYARENAARAEQFLERLHAGGSVQSVSLAAGAGAYLHLLGPGLQKFIRQGETAAGRYAPPRLFTLDREATLAAVRSGQAHLGVAPLDTVPEGFEAHPLATVGQVLVLPTNHPLAARRKFRLRDLADAALVVPPPDRPHRQMLNLVLGAEKVPWKVAVEVNGWDMMLHFTALGLGFAVVNAYCRLPRGLVSRPIEQLPTLDFQLFHLRGAATGGEVARLKTCLLKERDAWKK